MSNETTWPGVSVVMPVLNEERHLATAVEHVLLQRYSGPVEVIMAVGPSSDRTEEVAAELVAAHEQVVVIDNPTGRTPAGLNLAIAASRFDFVVRVDAHGELAPGYLETAVETLLRTGAANVGGLMDAQGVTPFESAVAAAYNSPLGLGGNAFHLESTPEGPAETVFLGAFRKEALEALGGFDETLHRAQDWDLNHRLIQAGELVWFTPALRVTYRPRSSVRALARQFFDTGRWRREVIDRDSSTIRIRYLVPPFTVAGLAVGEAAWLVGSFTKHRWLRWGRLAPLAYLLFLGVASGTIRGELDARSRAWLPVVLAVMHMSWGAGFLVGRPSG